MDTFFFLNGITMIKFTVKENTEREKRTDLDSQ